MTNKRTQQVIDFANTIKGLITAHYNITGNSSKKGHVQAGGAPQDIGTSSAAGTDNGYYARADHVHKASYNNLIDKPTIPSANTTASNIKMDGTQSAGSATTYAKADHIHPTDTSRAAINHEHNEYTKIEFLADNCGWSPILNGSHGASVMHTYSESNGEAVGRGFLLNKGFPNTDKWELSFDFKHDDIRYTGIVFLMDASVDIKNINNTSNRLVTWEGSWPGGTAYATYTAGTVGYFDVKVTKIDATHVRVQSKQLDRDTTVEVSWLPNVSFLSCGANHHTSANYYGPCRIKNVHAIISQPIVDKIYPVGSIYMSVNNTNPSTLFGGTWEQLKDRFLLGAGSTYSNGSTGGEASHTLTVNEMPAHNHQVSSGWNPVAGKDRVQYTQLEGGYRYNGNSNEAFIQNTGGGAAHNNMPPYLTVYMWKRTA